MKNSRVNIDTKLSPALQVRPQNKRGLRQRQIQN